MAQSIDRIPGRVYDNIALPSVLTMRQRTEMHGPNDDWSGTTDPAKRRKIQNRLHQRAWRKRQMLQRKLGIKAEDAGAASHLVQRGSLNVNIPSSETSEPPLNLRACDDGEDDKTQQSLTHFAKYAHARYLEGSPRTDLLLTLIKFNVFRALMTNNQTLGFANQWLQCDAVSPFFLSCGRTRPNSYNCPTNLMPTDLQVTVEHHPWIDLLPDPRMRNNILLLGDGYDDEPLCHDVVDNRHGKHSESLIVWGDPYNPENWEIGEDFYKRWHTVLEGCHQLFRATNDWRLRRGEPKFFPDTLCDS